MLADNLAHAHVDPAEVLTRLRTAVVRHLGEVACVILESSGQISVIRRGAPLDEELLAGVVGAQRVPWEG